MIVAQVCKNLRIGVFSLSLVLLSFVLVDNAGAFAERVLLFKQRIEATFDVAEALIVWLNQDGSLVTYELEIREESGQQIGVGFFSIPEGRGPTLATVLAIGPQGELWAAPVTSSFTVFQGSVRDAEVALSKAKGQELPPSTPIPAIVPPQTGSTTLGTECSDLERANAELEIDIRSLEHALSAMEQESSEVSLNGREKALDLGLRQLLDILRRELEEASKGSAELSATGPDFQHIPLTELEDKLERVRSQREALEQEMAGWGIF